MNDSDQMRLADLEIARATDTLTADEHAELEALRERLGTDGDFDGEIALTWAALQGAETAEQSLPPALAARVRSDADAFFGEGDTPTPSRAAPPARIGGIVAWSGWAAAALLALMLWPAAPDAPLNGDAALADLRANAIDALDYDFGASSVAGYEEARGDVTWSDVRQQGYLRLAGLPRNDPTEAQYQLWIVDPERDDAPVDGGVFDITADAVTLPFTGALPVVRPVAFAITREHPGGVVVSDGPMLLVAEGGR